MRAFSRFMEERVPASLRREPGFRFSEKQWIGLDYEIRVPGLARVCKTAKGDDETFPSAYVVRVPWEERKVSQDYERVRRDRGEVVPFADGEDVHFSA